MSTMNTVRKGALVRSLLFYAALVLLLLAIFNKWIGDILPSGPTNQISHNSEAYLLALVICAWIQWVLAERSRVGAGFLGLVAGVICLVAAILLKNSDLESHYATLNETFFALAFVLPYLSLFRWDRLAPIFSLLLVIGLLIANDSDVVIKGAEAWMVLVLAPLSFDIFDRTLVDRRATESHGLRLGWMAVLIALPALAIALDGHVSGNVEGIRDYVSRANEAFVGLLIVHAYFGYWVRSARAGGRLSRSG